MTQSQGQVAGESVLADPVEIGPDDDPAPLFGPLRLALFTPVREYPPLGDRKSVALLGSFGLALSVLLLFSEPINALVEGPSRLEAQAVLILLTPIIGSSLFGLWCAFRALTMPIPSMPTSLAFFQHIAPMTLEEYQAKVQGVSYGQALRDMLHYNYSLAILSARKFRFINQSIWCFKVLVPPWIALLLMLSALRSG
ncbi:hypothetical protein BH23PLA1_BH23PLA1_16920 [soil metagenome]